MQTSHTPYLKIGSSTKKNMDVLHRNKQTCVILFLLAFLSRSVVSRHLTFFRPSLSFFGCATRSSSTSMKTDGAFPFEGFPFVDDREDGHDEETSEWFATKQNEGASFQHFSPGDGSFPFPEEGGYAMREETLSEDWSTLSNDVELSFSNDLHLHDLSDRVSVFPTDEFFITHQRSPENATEKPSEEKKRKERRKRRERRERRDPPSFLQEQSEIEPAHPQQPQCVSHQQVPRTKTKTKTKTKTRKPSGVNRSSDWSFVHQIRSVLPYKEFWSPEEDALLIQRKRDLSSPTWKEVSKGIPKRTWRQCSNRWVHLKKQTSVRGSVPSRDCCKKTGWISWTPEEDCLLLQTKRKTPTASWANISTSVPRRDHYQCRNRWAYLKRTARELRRKKQTKEYKGNRGRNMWCTNEDALLVSQRQKRPNALWSCISQHIPGRTARQCSNRWNHIKKAHAQKKQHSDPPSLSRSLSRSLSKEMEWEWERQGEMENTTEGSRRTREWTPEEDALLYRLKQEQPSDPWWKVSQAVQWRSAAACRTRWGRIRPRQQPEEGTTEEEMCSNF